MRQTWMPFKEDGWGSIYSTADGDEIEMTDITLTPVPMVTQMWT